MYRGAHKDSRSGNSIYVACWQKETFRYLGHLRFTRNCQDQNKEMWDAFYSRAGHHCTAKRPMRTDQLYLGTYDFSWWVSQRPHQTQHFHWIIRQLIIYMRRQLASPSLRGKYFVFCSNSEDFNWHKVFAFFNLNHSITDSVDMNLSEYWKMMEETWLSEWRATNNQSNGMKGQVVWSHNSHENKPQLFWIWTLFNWVDHPPWITTPTI